MVGAYTLRPAIWAALRKLHREGAGWMTATRVRAELVSPPPNALETIHTYLRALEAAAIVERAWKGDPDGGAYRLLRDEGIEAPRVRADGSRVVMGQGREAMWRTMRILTRPWSVRELAAHAGTDRHPIAIQEADDYARRLCRAGYLQRTAPGTYRLIPARYTGPQPPQIRRTKAVWDPNLGRLAPWEQVWRGEA